MQLSADTSFLANLAKRMSVLGTRCTQTLSKQFTEQVSQNILRQLKNPRREIGKLHLHDLLQQTEHSLLLVYWTW